MESVQRVTVWDDRVTTGERAALFPTRPDQLDRRPDVLVIGGGVIGLSIAVFCRRAGLGRVVVLEQSPRLAPGASTGNGGAIAPDMHVLSDGPEFVAFGRRSRQLYRDLDADWAGAIGAWPTRWLDVRPEDDIPAGVWPRLDAAQVRELEPDVRLPDGAAALLVEGQLTVNPVRLAAALARRAGQVATGVAMLGVSVQGDRVCTVHTTAGDFEPGALVVATGVLPRPWHHAAPQRWVKGHMLALARGPWRLRSVLGGVYGGGTPLPWGGVICGGTFDEGDTTRDVRPEVSDPMAAAFASLVPAAKGARIANRWCCFRPFVEGRQPVIDRLPGVDNAWFAGGHFTTGVMMAPATGAAVAAWIGASGGAAPPEVRTFALPA